MKVRMTSLRRSLLIPLLVISALIPLNLSSARNAEAATGWDRCPRGYLCVFENPNGEGHFAYFYKGAIDLTKPIGGFVFNDRISSVWSRTQTPDGWCFYRDTNYGSPLFSLRGNNKTKTNLPHWADNQTSSLRILFGCADAPVIG